MNRIIKFKEYVLKYQLGSTLDNVSFKCLTTLGIGGTCKLLYIPDDLETLLLSIKYLYNMNIKYFIIGSGTNLLVNDKEYDMVVIMLRKLKRCYIQDEDEENYYIYTEAGVRSPILSKYLIDRDISGAEFLSIIPGSIGGLIYMNAGAYKKSISDIIYSVTFLDNETNMQTVLNINDNLKFKYRDSIFKHNNYIILSTVLKLPKNNNIINSKNKIQTYISKKKETQPLDTHNAGSTFKNLDNISAWELIDKLGYRGYMIGGAQVSNKHANFLINTGNATFMDMITLINMIKYDVYKEYKIQLDCEWEIID